MQIIFPSAKLVGEELQKLGKLPAIIYPINQGIVFDYLYNQYHDVADSLEVICYENADKVHRRLSGYRSSKVNIVDLPTLGDLGHTVYFGLDEKAESVIINFGDTIVMEEISCLGDDCFYYSEDYRSETWTFFGIIGGRIGEIYDKIPEKSEIKGKEKLFVGVFRFSDVPLLKKCFEFAFSNRSNNVSTFYQAIQLYSKEKPLNAIYTDKWFDIGHSDKYYNSTLEVKAREFNHITIDKNRGILRKSSDDVEKFIGEIKWYLKLPADIEYVRPRIFDYSTSYADPHISMEYYAYHTVHELFLFSDLTSKQWKDIFARIAFVCNDFRRYSVNDKSITESLEEMYLIKIIQRFNQMRMSDSFTRFFGNRIIVNHNSYQPLDDIITSLRSFVPEMLYDIKEFNIIHGDLCFSNIMVDSNFSFIKVIDPRGKFGKFDIYGDPRYELAKLFHSVDGKYDYIIKDLFDVEYDVNSSKIQYAIHDRIRDYDLYQLFLESFTDEIGNELKKIELIEALLFLSMIPLHSESIEHQMVMLGTGLDILNRVVDITA